MESITPFTRKEKYINQIVGGGDTAPKTPQTREELFFADILGEVVAPSPITRAEKYLAKIANKYSGELPEPVTRIERFLARAAGMDVTIPTPITREEMFWADYALIVEKEISGIPPLRFNAIAGALKNYRIYGNTVNGESVGDLVESGEHSGEYVVPVKIEGKNLCDSTIQSGAPSNLSSTTRMTLIAPIAIEEGKTYYCSTNAPSPIWKIAAQTNETSEYPFTGDFKYCGNTTNPITTIPSFTATRNGYLSFSIWKDGYSEISPEDFEYWIMVEKSSTLTDYEPYHVPTTTNIYLPEQIKKVGDEAEYIDFMEQKQHFADGTSADVTLPAMPTLSGTNMLSVGTEVQPSNVYIKYEGER